MARLTAGQIAGAAQAAGFRGANLTIATAIALAESSGDSLATHVNSDGSTDYGLWQINSVHAALLAAGTWSDPNSNAAMAFSVSGSGTSFTPWATFNSGAYLAFMSEAQGGANNPGGGSGNTSTALLNEVMLLAAAVHYTYIYGGTGPPGYDCSGLVWASLTALKAYAGPRFTTVTLVSSLGSLIAETSSPAVGDIVLWASHVGVVDGPDTMFSALNPSIGIVHSPISWGPTGEGAPTYWRGTGAAWSSAPGSVMPQAKGCPLPGVPDLTGAVGPAKVWFSDG
jgi:cell wall-associated NlpC family hydrolase